MASSAKKKIYDYEKMKAFRRWVPWNPRARVAETAFHALGDKRTNQIDACQLIQYLSAALTGTVLFSTTIFAPSATSAICLAADSMYFKSGARPWNMHECF